MWAWGGLRDQEKRCLSCGEGGERSVLSVTEKGREERKTQGDTAEMDKWRDRGRIKEKAAEEARGKGERREAGEGTKPGGAGGRE